jgi:hypothetical protein
LAFLARICTAIRASPLSVIFAFSHWLFSCRAMVRDGTSAATLMPSRLYHARSEDAIDA